MLTKKKFYFLSGIPRSGSTVLSSILAQNPNIYASGTSCLFNICDDLIKRWPEYTINYDKQIPEQITNTLRYIFDGFYNHINNPIILDKSRAWPSRVPGIKEILCVSPKIIVTVRDIPDVLASYLLLNRPPKQAYIDKHLLRTAVTLNDYNRCEYVFRFLNYPLTSFKTGYMNFRSNLLLIDYNEIVNDPKEVINKVYNFLEIPYFEHTFKDLVINETENDLKAYGINGLHEIRPVIKKTSPPAEEVLGKSLYNLYKNKKMEFWKNNL